MYIVPIDSDGHTACASCNANWSVPMLAEAHETKRLRTLGFAFIWFDDGAILINHCPHCEAPILKREAPLWPISPLFP